MRTLSVVALVLALGACKAKPRSEPSPSRNPYHDVMPAKVKQQVEETQKKEEERNDKMLENAK